MRPSDLGGLLSVLAEVDSISWDEIKELLPFLVENTEFSEDEK